MWRLLLLYLVVSTASHPREPAEDVAVRDLLSDMLEIAGELPQHKGVGAGRDELLRRAGECEGVGRERRRGEGEDDRSALSQREAEYVCACVCVCVCVWSLATVPDVVREVLVEVSTSYSRLGNHRQRLQAMLTRLAGGNLSRCTSHTRMQTCTD